MHRYARYAVRTAAFTSFVAAISFAQATTLCVNHDGSHGCCPSIQAAVTAASAGDVFCWSGARRVHDRERAEYPLHSVAQQAAGKLRQ